MKIHKLKLGPLRTNAYILEKNNYCLIIDCPSDLDKDINEINQICKNKEILAIIYTHNHFDHIGGGYKFRISQYMHDNDIESLNKQIFLAQEFKYTPLILPQVQSTEEITPEILNIFKFKILETPGHTDGGICIYFPKEKICFTGDTLFKKVFGRTDIGGNETEMKESLKLLFKLKSDIVIYPGHGYQSTIGEERSNLYKFLY